MTTPQNVFDGMADVVAISGDRARLLCGDRQKPARPGGPDLSGLGPHFDITRCADEPFKPDPLMLEESWRSGYEPEEAVMIGDTRYDLDMAGIGMPSIGVEWGVHQRDVLQEYDPHAVVTSVDELRRVLGL